MPRNADGIFGQYGRGAQRLDFGGCGIETENGTTFAWRAGVAGRMTIGFSKEGDIMSVQSRIESLKERHATLETRIADEDHRPRPDEDTLRHLKLEKLRLKEELGRLEQLRH